MTVIQVQGRRFVQRTMDLPCSCGGTYHMEGHVPGTDTEAQTMRVQWKCDLCNDVVWGTAR